MECTEKVGKWKLKTDRWKKKIKQTRPQKFICEYNCFVTEAGHSKQLCPNSTPEMHRAGDNSNPIIPWAYDSQ